jgi:Zn-dependent protease
MKWSFQIIKIFGIPIKIHLTFFLLPIIVLFSKDGLGGLKSGIFGLLMIIFLFIIVIIHELSHSIVARSFGARIRDITLLPIGGVARMEEIPENPGQEIFIAAAGPASNFILASALFLMAAFTGNVSSLIPDNDAGLLSSLFIINLMLGIFNLIPAFPMDGGRILRGLLAAFLPYLRATNIAATIGQFLAVIAIVADIFFIHSWWFVIIGLFIFLGAEVEGKAAEVKTQLEDRKVRDVMVRGNYQPYRHPCIDPGEDKDRIPGGFPCHGGGKIDRYPYKIPAPFGSP